MAPLSDYLRLQPVDWRGWRVSAEFIREGSRSQAPSRRAASPIATAKPSFVPQAVSRLNSPAVSSWNVRRRPSASRLGRRGRMRRRPGRELIRLPHTQFSNESPGTLEKWRVLFVTRVHLSATA